MKEKASEEILQEYRRLSVWIYQVSNPLMVEDCKKRMHKIEQDYDLSDLSK